MLLMGRHRRTISLRGLSQDWVLLGRPSTKRPFPTDLQDQVFGLRCASVQDEVFETALKDETFQEKFHLQGGLRRGLFQNCVFFGGGPLPEIGFK